MCEEKFAYVYKNVYIRGLQKNQILLAVILVVFIVVVAIVFCFFCFMNCIQKSRQTKSNKLLLASKIMFETKRKNNK